MRAHILGSSASGELPHWGCSCRNCEAARRRDPRVLSRTHDSLAVFGRDGAAVLCNASPDVSRQLAATPALHPRERHDSPIAAVVLTNGELEHVLGLFALADRPLAVYSTDEVRRGVIAHGLPAHVTWRQLELDREVEVADLAGAPTGVVVRPFALPGKLPAAEANIGVSLACARTGTTIVYAPHCGNVPAHLGDDADALLFDGTLWSNDELLSQELADERAVDLAHLPVGGLHGGLVQLARCTAKRKIFTHVSHTNPMLRHDSRERLAVASAGWEIAEDDTILSWANSL
jgi:pyrroloquinoline quinone biosynthesis protein B